ncbi:hypothetical protein EJB05_04728 [Eragrostis curvula]|uniref:Uncharacterized protein n=1 Tax=Eragrostis curvula TaxID=38414 RepID=A0A5J9WA81_9POAL|nr:hypothetical protein EJB05_04728 [Eragrostis curvula]
MASKFPCRVHVHAGGGHCHRSLLLLHLVACFALLPPLSHAASVVTHLPGFDGPLPFYLETGYVGVEEETGTELFYYFVESERSPATDAVLLWFSGGPRWSTLNGLLLEIGRRRGRMADVNLLLPHLVACLLLVPFSCAAASVVTHLPGYDGPLPFYLETGYVGVEEETGTELFYYFVESERSPATDAVLLWLTGGPRCSSFSGLAFETGPIKFVLEPYNGSLPRLVRNPYSWTQVASILFLDSPVGSGFSYARDPKGYSVGDYSSSLQVRTFLKKGYLVGNPITDPKFDQNSIIPASHGFGVISDQLYEAAVDNCEGDYVNPKNEICAAVLHTVNNLISEIAQAHILYKVCAVAAPKPADYDDQRRFLSEELVQLRKPPPRPSVDCFTFGYYLAYFWMNNNATRYALGVKEGTTSEWIRCVDYLPYAQDLVSSINYHLNLTTRGYRALVYSGDHDLIIPHLGTQAWIRSLNFSIVDEWRAWHLDGQAAGFTITYANSLTFATVKGAGHTAPEYRPKESFAMAQRRYNT